MANTRSSSAAKKRPAATKKTTTRRKSTTPKPADIQVPSVHINTVSEGEKQAKLEAYNALKQAGVAIPEELRIVEDWLAELQAQREQEQQRLDKVKEERAKELEKANQNGPWYVRNGYPAPFNLRLDRQTEKRRIELKPRGTPGDLHPLLEEDLKDPVIRQNLQLGLIEIVPAGEANLIIEKQTTNMSHRVHTPLAMLTNEYGKPYEQGQVKVEAEFNSQGVTVARVEPGLMQGQLHDKQVGGTRATGGITRVQPGQQVGQPDSNQATSVVRSGFVPTGGNPAIVQYGPHQQLNADAHARAVDDLARRKSLQGPSAGLGNVSVVVDPVQHT